MKDSAQASGHAARHAPENASQHADYEQAIARLAESNRALRMLSRCNEALIRTDNEGELLRRICTIAVEMGGYRMAWVGFAQDNEARTITPAAWAGVDDGYIASTSAVHRVNPPSVLGPPGRALRSGQAVVTTDLTADPTFAPWLEPALSRGYRGQVVLPLTASGHSFGVLAMYLPEPRPLPPEEVKLLQELADDLAFGIVTLRAHALRRRTYDGVLAMAKVVSREPEGDFFDTMAQGMAEALELHAVLMARPAAPGKARTFSALIDGLWVNDFDFTLAGTPFDDAGLGDLWAVPRDAAGHFPEGHPVAGMGIESCAGATLRDRAGDVTGWMLILVRRRLVQPDFLTSMLSLCAKRVANELVRQEVHDRLLQQASLLDKAQDAIMVRTLDHRILFWNHGAERLYGWSPAEALGRHVTELMVRDSPVMDHAVQHLTAHGEWKGELEHYTRSGRALTVEAHWTLVRDAQGRPEKILAINTDVTERKEVLRQVERLNTELEQRVQVRTQQLEEANRELEAFSYSVSHDLRAPLNTIDGFSQILSRNAGAQLNEREQHYLNRIRNGVRQMSELIDALLVLAKITRMKPRREAVDMSALAASVAEEARQRVPGHPVEFSVQPGMQAAGDSRMLRQVFANLLGNSWKFTGKTSNARVEVGSQPGGDGPTVFFVRDNGAGFDMAYADRLFGAFQRLHPAREFEGTGIGLATVQRIVSLHGGRIWVQAAQDQGATFYFTLPGPEV